MSTTLDEPVTVELTDGQPAVFWWQRFPYVIEGQPLVLYLRRPPWWTGAGNIQRLDDEFWRVSAARDGSGDEPELYDIPNDGNTLRLTLHGVGGHAYNSDRPRPTDWHRKCGS